MKPKLYVCIIVCRMMLCSIYRGYFVEIWIVVSMWGNIFFNLSNCREILM